MFAGTGDQVKSSSRRAYIHEAIALGPISVGALAHRFGVSESTIRRDLARMNTDGLLLRTYGGAASPIREQGISEREQLNRTEKGAIAEVAATYVADGQQIYLDSGSTCGALAGLLSDRHGLTVVTSGISIVDRFATAEGVDTVLLGGTFRRLSMGTVGPHAEATMRRMQVEIAFLGADGIDPKRGLCEVSFEQSSLKDTVISHASAVVVVVDSTKLGCVSTSRAWTPLEVPWTLITDSRATPEQLRPYDALDRCHVVVAGSQAGPADERASLVNSLTEKASADPRNRA